MNAYGYSICGSSNYQYEYVQYKIMRAMPQARHCGASREGRLRVYTLSYVGIDGLYNVGGVYVSAYNLPPFHDQ